MNKLRLVIFVLGLSSCAPSPKAFLEVFSADFISKDSEVALVNRMEATPFVWNGRLHTMVSHRDHDLIEIYDGDTLVHAEPSTLNFAAAYVEAGRLYVFGTYNDDVLVIESTDLVTWSAPRVVKARTPGRTLYNVSVAPRSSGGYIMSYETCEPGTVCFNIRFAESPDLYSFTDVGAFFSPDAYAACPSIREIDGVYYMTYLKDFGHWATVVARSTDLVSWETSKTVAFSALKTPGETMNNSDVDFVEFGGKVHFTYAIGDQVTFTHMKRATYDGTLKEFFNEFF